MRRLKLISLLLLLSVLLSGCQTRPGDAVTVDINLVGFEGTSFDAQLNEGADAWDERHPEATLYRRERVGNDDFIRIGAMGPEHMPDVFITDCITGRILADAGLVADLTGYAEDVNTFNYDEGICAFPIMRESLSVVVYDPLNWEEGMQAGFCSNDKHTVTDAYLSAVLGSEEGQEWFYHMDEADFEASFTDQLFMDALDEVHSLMNEGIPYGSVEELTDAFVNGEVSAVVAYGNVVYDLLDRTRTENPELYSRLGFTDITGGVVPSGYHYGVFIRSGLDEDKFALCVDLAREIASSYEGITDETTERLHDLTENSVRTEIITNYFIHWFWNYASTECFSDFYNDDTTSEQYAFVLQNYYEIYYTDG